MPVDSLNDVGHLTKEIVNFASDISYSDVPPDVIEHTKLVLLDTLGAILAASNPKYPAGRIIAGFVRNIGGVEESTIIGQGFKSSCVNAALVNATFGYYCDIEAYDPEAVVHAAAAVVPTCLAVGEREKLDGKHLLLALILGIDVSCRVSLALNPRVLYKRGFHPSSIAGTIGAAVAAGHLLNLNVREYPVALGLAAQQTSGLLAWKEDFSENSRSLNCGIAARNGVTAALLARLGFGGPPDIFEGIYNIFRAYSRDSESNPDQLTRNLGADFFIMEHAFKRYSCCGFLHPGLDALLGIMDEHNLESGDIGAIILRFPKNGTELIDGTELRSHSAQYMFAIAALDRQVMIDDISYDRRSEPEINRLVKKVEVVGDEGLDVGYPEQYPSIVEITTTESKRFSKRVDYAAGTPQNPFTRDEIEKKFFELSGQALGESTKKAIRDLVRDIEQVKDVGLLIGYLQGKPQHVVLE